MKFNFLVTTSTTKSSRKRHNRITDPFFKAKKDIVGHILVFLIKLSEVVKVAKPPGIRRAYMYREGLLFFKRDRF